MALTITWDEYHGGGEVKSDNVTNLVFGSSDSADFTPMDYPITAGLCSYGKYVKVDFAGMAGEGVTEIQTAKIHKSAGAYVTDEVMTFDGLSVSYATPSQDSLGNSAIPTSTPGAQNLGLGGSDTGVLVADGQSDYGLFQIETSSSTPNGALNNKTITVTWDQV